MIHMQKSKIKYISVFLALICFVLSLNACDFQKTDYSKVENWVHCNINGINEVDTFFVYPTVVMQSGNGDFADFSESKEEAKYIYEYMAKAFEESTNIYMPVYRQATMVPAKNCNKDNQAYLDLLYKNVPYKDIADALDYYFENFNDGKPFILASHSQGSALVTDILMHYMQEHPEYLERMVAAYTIGYAPSKAMFEKYPNLKFAEGESDCGVVVSWNTEGPDASGDSILMPSDPCVINPINWKTDSTYASADENKGTNSPSNPDLKADAQINLKRGTVICTTCDNWTVAEGVFQSYSLHEFDYSLYFHCIEDNAQKRIDTYFALHQ